MLGAAELWRAAEDGRDLWHGPSGRGQTGRPPPRAGRTARRRLPRGERDVAALVARIARQVLGGPELGRVDEEAHDDHVALGAGAPHEAQMALVKGAHRRHEADRAAGLPGRGERVGSSRRPCGRASSSRLRARARPRGCRSRAVPVLASEIPDGLDARPVTFSPRSIPSAGDGMRLGGLSKSIRGTSLGRPRTSMFGIHPQTFLASPTDLPIYEFACSNCDHRFEELVKVNGSSPAVPCPGCGSARTIRLMSAFAVGRRPRRARGSRRRSRTGPRPARVDAVGAPVAATDARVARSARRKTHRAAGGGAARAARRALPGASGLPQVPARGEAGRSVVFGRATPTPT